MATARENLQTARDNVALRIKQITESPKPSYSIDGKSVSWTEYLDMLLRQFRELEALANGPFEVRSRAVSY